MTTEYGSKPIGTLAKFSIVGNTVIFGQRFVEYGEGILRVWNSELMPNARVWILDKFKNNRFKVNR
jgi:hypothetical protein